MGRRLGQHFLNDPAILDQIVDAIAPGPADIVVEIGPGKGALTHRLAPRVGGVVAIEADEVLASRLRQSVAGAATPVTVVTGDALRMDWLALAGGRRPKVIGNIPYYISSPLIEKALSPPLPAVIVFLVQREFADRAAAVPGSKTYGGLSAGVQSVASVERLFTVRAGAFTPPPRVDSAAIRLVPLVNPLVSPSEHPAFRAFLAALFGQRRKQLVRSLRDVLGREKEEIEELLRGLGIDPSARPEVLSPGQLVAVFRDGSSLAPRARPGKL